MNRVKDFCNVNVDEFKRLKGRINKKCPFTIVCFESFDLNEYKKHRNSNKLKDSIIYYFIHYFIKVKNSKLSLSYKDSNGNQKWTSVNLSMRYAENLYSQKMKEVYSKYAEYMDYLRCVDKKVPYVFKRINYIPKTKSFSYYHEESFPKLKFVEIEENNILKYEYKNSRKLQKLLKCYKPSSSLEKIENLLDDYDLIDIDLNLVKLEMDKLLDEGKITYNQYVRAFLDAANIKSGYFSFKRNENSDGRLHSQFQSATKLIRQFVTLGGRRMKEVDISSSVPAFFASKIKRILTMVKNNDIQYCNSCNTFNQYESCAHDIIPNLHINRMSSVNNLVDSKLIEVISQNLDIDERDKLEMELTVFTQSLVNGNLYDSISEGYHETLIEKYGSIENYKSSKNKNYKFWNIESFEGRRDYIKKNFLSMLNSKPGTRNYKRINEVFKKKFPLMESLNSIIKSFSEVYNNSCFALAMFQKESEFILDTVCQKIKERNDGFLLLTIHDCVITTEDRADDLKRIMDELIREKLEFECQTKLKEVTTISTLNNG